MIDLYNFKEALQAMGFIKSSVGDYYEKRFGSFRMAADFDNKKLYYPEGMETNDNTTTNFSHNENFVVFECVNRLMEKGYLPEDVELEPRWRLGHESKSSGKPDILIRDKNGDNLIIIECKTAGKEYRKEKANTETDGGQLFSYWQQDNGIKWLPDLLFSEDSQAYQIQLKPLRKKDLKGFTADDKIVNRFEEILRHNNVSDKENAFNRLVALFICKLVDEIKKQDYEEVAFQYKYTDTYETLQDRLQLLHQQGMKEFMEEDIFYVPDDYAENLFSNYTGQKRKAAIEDLKKTIRILKFYSNNDFAFKDVHNEELFYQNGKILVEVVQLFQPYRIVYPSKQFLGDLFEQLLNIRPYLKKLWLADRDGGCSPDVLVLHVDKEKAIPEYVYYCLRRDAFFDYVMSDVKGLKMPRGKKETIGKYTFPLPDFEEQARIVEQMSHYDKAIDELRIRMSESSSNKQAILDNFLK